MRRRVRETLLRKPIVRRRGFRSSIHSYELRRSHFAGIEEIFLQDYELPPPRQGSRLSAHDALILSMANEYRLAHPADSVAIVTEDRRIVDFCLAFRDDFPRGVRISTQNAV